MHAGIWASACARLGVAQLDREGGDGGRAAREEEGAAPPQQRGARGGDLHRLHGRHGARVLARVLEQQLEHEGRLAARLRELHRQTREAAAAQHLDRRGRVHGRRVGGRGARPAHKGLEGGLVAELGEAAQQQRRVLGGGDARVLRVQRVQVPRQVGHASRAEIA